MNIGIVETEEGVCTTGPAVLLACRIVSLDSVWRVL
jgi:hypothetical protein